MSMEKPRKTLSRRSFLRAAGTGSAGAAATAVVVATLGEGEPAAEAAPADRRDGYRETPHVRHYYATARF